jgi:hypothetical protein
VASEAIRATLSRVAGALLALRLGGCGRELHVALVVRAREELRAADGVAGALTGPDAVRAADALDALRRALGVLTSRTGVAAACDGGDAADRLLAVAQAALARLPLAAPAAGGLVACCAIHLPEE